MIPKHIRKVAIAKGSPKIDDFLLYRKEMADVNAHKKSATLKRMKGSTF